MYEVCECVSSRQALFLHRQALTEQLKETEDPALVLHLTSVLLFQASTQCMLHAPGRCVPQIIGTLTGRIPTVCPSSVLKHWLPACVDCYIQSVSRPDRTKNTEQFCGSLSQIY